MVVHLVIPALLPKDLTFKLVARLKIYKDLCIYQHLEARAR